MKGARRTRKPRQQAGFADLMTSSPSSNSLRGVVTGVSRAQRSNPTTPTPTPSNPTSPPPPDDDWGALLHITPKRRFSPQKPIRGTTTPRSSSSRSSTTLSPRHTPSIHSPRHTSPPPPPPPPPPQISNSFASPPVSHTPLSNIASQSDKSAAVPGFLSGWDGADGWGDDPALDDSDHETQNDPWGVWPQSDDILSQTQPDPHAEENVTPVSAKPVEQTVTYPVVEPHLGQHHPVAHTSLPHTEEAYQSVHDAPHQPNTDETQVTLTNDQVQPITPQPETIETPSETATPAEPQLPRDETKPTARIDEFSSWAVEEPPQQPLDEFPEPDTQHTAAEDTNIPVTVKEEEKPEIVPPAEPQIPAGEADGTAGFDGFSGWAVEEPPQQPLIKFPESDTQYANAAHATAAEDTNIPITVKEEEQPEIIPPAETEVPADEIDATAGFDGFSGWAVEEPSQQPFVEFPEPDTQHTDAVHDTAAEDTNVPITALEGEQTQTVATADPHVPEDATGATIGFDGWAVEEPPQQPLDEFPEPDTQHSAAEDSSIPVTVKKEEKPEIVPPTEPQIPADEADGTAGFDGFSGWAVEEPPQQPLEEFPALDTQQTDPAHSTSGRDAGPVIISKDDQRYPEGILGTSANAAANTETNGDELQQTTRVESVADPRANHGGDYTALAAEASTQPNSTQTSFAVDPWAFNDTSANVPADDAGWGWGEPDVVPSVQPQSVEKPRVSENTSVTVPSNTTAREISTSSTVAASMLEERKDEAIEKPIEVAFVGQKEAEPQRYNPRNTVLAKQSASGKDGWEMNEGANEVSLDDWGWGAQTDEDAVEFSIGVNSSEVQTTGPPPSTFSHLSDSQAHANEWSNFGGDHPFSGKEETTIQNDNVNTTAGDSDAYTANTDDGRNADFRMYAPSKGNAERENVEFAETQQVGGASHDEDPAIDDRLGFEPHVGEAKPLHVGAAESSYSKAGLAEEGAATRHEEEYWNSNAAFPDLNVSSTKTAQDLAATSVPPPADEDDKVGDVVKSGTQTQLAAEVPKRERGKDYSGGPDNTSFLWSGYEEKPQPEADRSWADPDAIWSPPPIAIPSVVAAENENKKGAYATHQTAMETQSLSKDTPAAEMPRIQTPQSAAMAPVSIGAPDVSTTSFENDVTYPPIQQDMLQHRGREPHEASATSDLMISVGEKYSPKALDEKKKQNENSVGAADWQHSLQSNLQPQKATSSGVVDAAQPQNLTLSNSYWAERLDESRSLVPESGNETVPQALGEDQKTKGYESLSWSPSYDTSQTELMMKSAPSHSNAHIGSHEHNASSTQMTETVAGPWPASVDPHHHNGPQNVQWPAPKLAHRGSGRANQLEIAQKPLKTDHGVSADFKRDHAEVLPSEHSTTVAVTTENSLSSEWNQYAPRDNSLGDQIPALAPSRMVELPPVQQSAPEKQHVISGDEQPASADASTYDPFAVYQDESTADKTKVSYDAFDWGYDPQEASSNPQTTPPAFPAAEGREVYEAGSGPQQDSSNGAHSSTYNINLQSNVMSTLPAPNAEATTEQPPVDVFQQAFQTQNAFQMDSQVSYDWNASDQGDLPHSLEKKPADARNGPRENITVLQPESLMISSRVDPSKVVEADLRMNGEVMGAESTSRGTYDSVTNTAQDPQSPNSGVDLKSYAPRTTALRHPTENTSVAQQQIAFEDFDVQDSKPEFPQAAALMEPMAPEQTPHQSHGFAYQAAVPEAPSSYSPGAPYASSVPPVPATVNPDGSGYLQTGVEATGFTSPPAAPGIVPVTEQMYGKISTAVSHPSGQSTIPELLGETPEVHVTNVSNENQSPGQNGRDAGVLAHGRNGPPHVSSQSLHQQVMPHETVPEPPELSSDPWSSYGPRKIPGGTSVTTETTATQWNNVGTAYNSVDNSAQEQPGAGYDTIPDSATKAYGSYAMPNELNYNQDLSPPPQQAPYVPPSYLGEQGIFQAESIVDPSAFSYPYSIMDTETTGDFSTRPQRPLFSWGFGGKLVTVIPRVNTRSDGGKSQDRAASDATGSSTVHIHDLKDVTQDGSNDDWAAASEAVPPVSFPPRTPDLSNYAEMCDRLSKLSVGLKGAEAEGRAALWRVLALLCREGTSDWRVHASSAVSGPTSVPMFGRNDSSSVLPANSKLGTILREDQLDGNTSRSKKTDAATEVERLLTLGRGLDAIHVAQEAGLWSIALVLAATMDRSLYLKVVSGYAKSALHDGSALQTLCLSVAEDEAEIMRKATSPSGLREWRKTVGMLLTAVRATPNVSDAQQARFLRLIERIGEALISQNSDVVAGHVCFLISGRLGPLDGSNIQLLGADPKLPAGRPRGLGSPAAVLQSLVLEAAANAANGATYPHLLAHRLVLAEEICAVGRPEVALAHCESISSAVRSIFESGRQDFASQYFTSPFLSRLESLEERLLVHLDRVEMGTKKRGLTALGKSLSSVFTKRLTADSRSGQPERGDNRRDPTQFTGTRNIASFPPQPSPAASSPLQPIVSSEHLPNVVADPNWTPKVDIPVLQSQSTNQSSSNIQPEPPANDVSGNERWNSLVSKTIGFLAPAEGDLSPPLKARNDNGVPFHAQPVPLGLGGGTASRVPALDSHTGHMRSASVGDVPMLQRQEPAVQMHEQNSYSHQVPEGAHSQTGNYHTSVTKGVDQTTFNGIPVQKTTAAESNLSATHRRAASDMTFESQTSEKKPPRPPKKSPTLPSGVDMQPKREKVQAVKGWRSRLSEKIRAAFSGPPRAHMGVENKFKFDKERGRWVIEGEDPDENNDEPPPPPEDEPAGGQTAVPYSQSYESLPNPDLGNHFSSDSQAMLYQSDNELNREGSQMERVRQYSRSGQIALNNIPVDNGYSRDTGSESSVASAASAPAPYSSEPTIPAMATPGNKFRARPGRASGRRAYVDTLNKGTPPIAMSAAFPNPARPRPPVMNGLSSQAGGAYRIFTPSPACTSHGSKGESGSVPGSEGAFVTSSTVHSNENLYQARAKPSSENGPQGSSLGNDLKLRSPVQSA